MESIRVGKRGTVVIPAKLRRKFGIEEGGLLVAEEKDGGIVLRPAMAMPVEIYTPERIAQFLLNGAIDAADYRSALEEVRKMGLDPEKIPHTPYTNPPA